MIRYPLQGESENESQCLILDFWKSLRLGITKYVYVYQSPPQTCKALIHTFIQHDCNPMAKEGHLVCMSYSCFSANRPSDNAVLSPQNLRLFSNTCLSSCPSRLPHRHRYRHGSLSDRLGSQVTQASSSAYRHTQL